MSSAGADGSGEMDATLPMPTDMGDELYAFYVPAATTLLLTVPAGTPGGSYSLVALFSYHSNTDYHLWPVAIVAK